MISRRTFIAIAGAAATIAGTGIPFSEPLEAFEVAVFTTGSNSASWQPIKWEDIQVRNIIRIKGRTETWQVTELYPYNDRNTLFVRSCPIEMV